LQKSWEPADMTEYDYIYVPPSTTALWIGFFIIMLCNAGLSAWLILNDFHDDDRPHVAYRWKRRSF